MIFIDLAEQEVPKMGKGECVEKRSDCPGERGWETGYGMAGGGMGVYHYCDTCGRVVDKQQDPHAGTA